MKFYAPPALVLFLVISTQSACSTSEPDAATGPGASGGSSPGSTGGATAPGGRGGASAAGGSGGSTAGIGTGGTTSSAGEGGSGGAAGGQAGSSGAGGAAGAGGSGGAGGGTADAGTGTGTAETGAGDLGSGVAAETGSAATGDTWAGFARGFFASYCVSCHNDDNRGDATRDYHTLAVVKAEKTAIACGVAKSQSDWMQRGCTGSPRARQFPAGNGAKPSDADRDRLLRWLDANAP
jgi:hypothetical protein